MSDERRIELESKVAFLERTVEQLEEVVLEQGRELEALGRRLARLEGPSPGPPSLDPPEQDLGGPMP